MATVIEIWRRMVQNIHIFQRDRRKPMPLQNRVLPSGEIVSHPARGTFMGNRGGRIHTDARTLTKSRWKSKQWIICVLQFKSRHRRVMGQSYTELFFMDEPTALSAGHRPCFECRRAQAIEFALSFPGAGRTPAPDMDTQLHIERRQAPRMANFTDLPDGAMVEAGETLLKWRGQALVWSPTGYTKSAAIPKGKVHVLTPASTCKALLNGYKTQPHETAKLLI